MDWFCLLSLICYGPWCFISKCISTTQSWDFKFCSMHHSLPWSPLKRWVRTSVMGLEFQETLLHSCREESFEERAWSSSAHYLGDLFCVRLSSTWLANYNLGADPQIYQYGYSNHLWHLGCCLTPSFNYIFVRLSIFSSGTFR